MQVEFQRDQDLKNLQARDKMREAESETEKRKWDEQLELNKKITDENEELRLKIRAND